MANNKRCTSCGESNPGTAKFCRACGAKFTQSTQGDGKGSSEPSDSSSSNWGWLASPVVGYALFKLIQLLSN